MHLVIQTGNMDIKRRLNSGNACYHCEHGIEPSGSIKCWEVLEGLHNWQLLEKGSAP
jgi:hypothetical protein